MKAQYGDKVEISVIADLVEGDYTEALKGEDLIVYLKICLNIDVWCLGRRWSSHSRRHALASERANRKRDIIRECLS